MSAVDGKSPEKTGLCLAAQEPVVFPAKGLIAPQTESDMYPRYPFQEAHQ